MIYTHRKTTTDIIMDIQEEDTKQPVKNNEAYCVYKIHFITNTANVYRELRETCRENLQYLWKRAVKITEKPYTPQRERLRILWRNPVIFTDCGEILEF